jgi:hypothetical protein
MPVRSANTRQARCSCTSGPAPSNPCHHLGDIDAVVPRPDHGLEPTRRDDAGVHIDPGVRVDKGLITFHHERLEERNGRERGGHTLDEVDGVLPSPAVPGCRGRWPWRPGIGLPPTGRTLNVGEQKRHHPRRSSRPVSGHPRRISQQTRSYLALRRNPTQACHQNTLNGNAQRPTPAACRRRARIPTGRRAGSRRPRW